MKAIFADTYYFLAIGNSQDQGHARAAKFAKSYSGQILTSEWVLAEVGNALSGPQQRHRFIGLLNIIRKDPNWTVEEASHGLFEEGVRLFSDRQDKSWSLTDCMSFVVMKRHDVHEALTGDHHFKQAGFVSLLL